MSAHDFCRVLLSEARKEARESGVKIPANITTLQSTKRLYFVEADGVEGQYIEGDCATEARANYIRRIIDASAPK
jgi:hypothetical protein